MSKGVLLHGSSHCLTGRLRIGRLRKIHMEPKNEGSEDDFPFQLGDF